MFELFLKLPSSTYNQLQAAARKENKSIQDVLVELISQRFSSQAMSVENEREGVCHRFVTEWALPDEDQQKYTRWVDK